LLLALRLRMVVAAHDFARVPLSVPGGQSPSGLSLPISVGGACPNIDNSTPESLFAEADQALYQAKQQERNPTVLGDSGRSDGQRCD
jgi:GGDEF domain-containing protein